MVQHEHTIFAPMFWGFVISIFLGGITVVQAHVYFPARRDKPLIRWTAALMLLFDITSSALIAYSIYYYLIPEFGSFERFKAVTPQFSAECLIAALITCMSQLYFVHQLVVVKRAGKGSWILIGLIAGFATVALIGGIGCVSSMYIWKTAVLAQRNKAFTIFFALAKGFNALTDILATIAMCMFLTDQKGGIERTNNLLTQVMIFVVQRGILVTLIQILVLVTFLAAPNNLAWLALHMNVTRLYANTFFAMLNGRSQLREKHAGTIVQSLQSTNSRSHIETGHRQENINLDRFNNSLDHNVYSDSEAVSGWVPDKKTRIEEAGNPLPAFTRTVVITDR